MTKLLFVSFLKLSLKSDSKSVFLGPRVIKKTVEQTLYRLHTICKNKRNITKN